MGEGTGLPRAASRGRNLLAEAAGVNAEPGSPFPQHEWPRASWARKRGGPGVTDDRCGLHDGEEKHVVPERPGGEAGTGGPQPAAPTSSAEECPLLPDAEL